MNAVLATVILLVIGGAITGLFIYLARLTGTRFPLVLAGVMLLVTLLLIVTEWLAGGGAA